MKRYTVTISICGIEANNELEAKRSFWEIVDDDDYKINPKVEEE